MKYLNELTGELITEKQYLDIIAKETEEYYTNLLEEGEEIEISKASIVMKLIESDTDYVAVDDNGNILEW